MSSGQEAWRHAEPQGSALLICRWTARRQDKGGDKWRQKKAKAKSKWNQQYCLCLHLKKKLDILWRLQTEAELKAFYPRDIIQVNLRVLVLSYLYCSALLASQSSAWGNPLDCDQQRQSPSSEPHPYSSMLPFAPFPLSLHSPPPSCPDTETPHL